jgi:hypothetical protein
LFPAGNKKPGQLLLSGYHRPQARSVNGCSSLFSGSEAEMEKHRQRTAELETKQASPKSSGNKENASLTADSRNQRVHQKAITQGLRTFFDAVASEPVPDEFIELLKKLDEVKKDADA